jgi:uncharacterized membrane protein (UPF0127 family)
MSNQSRARSANGENEWLSLQSLRSDDRIRVTNETRNCVLVEQLRLALGPWTRFRGLLGTRALVDGQGLLLRPCRAIHTWMMSYRIDVAFVDVQGGIVGVLHELEPWRFSDVYAAALATLELPAGKLASSNTRIGDRLLFETIAKQ